MTSEAEVREAASRVSPALEIVGAEKSFSATRALAGVDFDVRPGEIHALVGENGAGKSTLIRVISGVYSPDAGLLKVNGETRHFAAPADALAAGVVTIPQELRLVPALTVAENIVLGRWPTRWGGLFLRRDEMRRSAAEMLKLVGVSLPLDLPAERLGFAERQLIVIAKALRLRPRILILDEPTAALERREVERLLQVLARLRQDGTAILYVSHKLDEVVEIADRCTVLRDGRVVDVSKRGQFDVAHLVRAMTGRDLEKMEIAAAAFGSSLLSNEVIDVREGEVVGVAGLLGSGAREAVYRLFGGGNQAPVSVSGAGRTYFGSPAQAMRAGIGMVPGERSLGLVLEQSVRDNIVLPSLSQIGSPFWISPRAGDRIAREMIRLLDIRPSDPGVRVSALSGGNQQKVIFAKWLVRNVKVLLLDEPTHGVDIAAKAQIHLVIREFAARGGGVVASSTDPEELLNIADTIVALKDGMPVGRVYRHSGMSERLLREMIGG